jgi:AcrR family transcriptional regulator
MAVMASLAPTLEVRERILIEATRLFAQRGYGSTSVREVVEAAGVTKPTLYYYFQSKEALFLEVVHTHLEALQELVEQALAVPGTVYDRLRRFANRYRRAALENVDAVRLLMTVQHPTDDAQPSVDVMSAHLRKIALLESVIAEGIARGELRADLDARTAVLALVGMVDLYLMAQLFGACAADAELDSLLDLYFHGVATR